MVTPHSLRQLCFGPAAAQIDPARSARSRPFRDRLIPPNQSVTEIIIVFPAFFVNTQMKIFRLLTAFSASFFLPCPQGDFSLFSLCRLLNLPRRELPFARGFAPPPPGGFCKAVSSCDPLCRRSARAWQSHARHPGDFPVAGKVTKGAPRAAPFGIPWCGISALIGAALTLAPGLPSATKKDRFATLSGWANRSFFLPKLHRGSHFLLSIRGAAGALASRMLEGLSCCNQYR